MTVVENSAGGFDVVEDGRIVRSGFANSAVAWRFVDQQEGEPTSPSRRQSARLLAGVRGRIVE